jgi:tetratricopeptide (TPR) repeat protein
MTFFNRMRGNAMTTVRRLRPLARITAIAALLALAALPAYAQDATATPTATPEPLPNCPAFQGESNSVRTGYYMGEGIAYLNANQLNEAEFSFTCIIRVIDPGYAQAYLGRAEVYEDLRDYEEALEDYNAALQINPNSLVARNNRGIVLTIIGDYVTAAADFDRVLSIDSNYLPGYNNRSIIYTLTGDYANALSTIDQGLRLAGVEAALAEARDEERPDNAPPVPVDPAGLQLMALRGILESAQALDSFSDYLELANASDNFPDSRISEAAGSLESRLTFDLRLDDGTWMIPSNFLSET